MTYTTQELAAIIQALPPENRPVIRAIIGELLQEREQLTTRVEYLELLMREA